MSPILAVIVILRSLIRLYMLVLLARVVLDWVQILARQWRPSGVVLVAANAVYALTDPPMRRLRQVVPVVRAGGMGIDLSFLVLYLGLVVVDMLLGQVGRLL